MKKRISVNNIKLFVEISGRGYPFIWGHSLMSNMSIEDITGWFEWNLLFDIIKLVRYDARGHGQSQASKNPEDYRWSSLADDIIAIAQYFCLDTFIAGGQSMGCNTALCAAEKYPNDIKALILVNPPTAWEYRSPQLELYEQLIKIIESEGKDGFIELIKLQRYKPQWLYPPKSYEQESFFKGYELLDESTLLCLLRGGQLSDLPSRKQIQSLKIPTVIFAWTDDPQHPIEMAEEIHSLMPQSKLIVATEKNDVIRWKHEMRNFVCQVIS